MATFAAEWTSYDGSERSEAQTFLNELFACYGQDRKSAGARFEDAQEGRFLDLIYPGVCIVEMKRPSEAQKLRNDREQALVFWRNSSDVSTGLEAPPYVVLCAFQKFEIWEPGRFPKEPRLVLDLLELPDNLEALQFLAGRQPVFKGNQFDLTREAVRKVAGLNNMLVARDAAPKHVIRDFVFQCVWCMFAEDVGMLPDSMFSRIVHGLIEDKSRSSETDLGQLFEYLNKETGRPTHGTYAGVPFANGGLFAHPAAVHLERDELDLLAEAGQGKWQDVEPAIFGGLLEGGLEHEQQWKLGAHYTHIADIQRIVEPTISRPWRAKIAGAKTAKEAERLRADLLNFVVLDPACGSGNFLYVAYRELRRISKELAEKIAQLRHDEGLPAQIEDSYFPLSNIRGIEIDAFAIALARVTLWMGHKLSVDELGLSEKTLPLTELSGIRQADALRVDWPEAGAIVGNPPFHGAQNIRRLLGDNYVDFLSREFGVGVKDYCVYWFRKAHDSLGPGRRAGLVGTNSIAQNRGRGASLEYIVANGGVITDAVSSEKWPGEAKVFVSIVNWIKDPAPMPVEFHLDGRPVDGITSSLREGSESEAATPLVQNKGRCFQGPIPVGEGFLLSDEEADALLRDPSASYGDVVRAYVVADDVANRPDQSPGRKIIDFGTASLEEAMAYPAALEIVRQRVKPFRDGVSMESRRKRWWQFGSNAVSMRRTLEDLPRYIVGTRLGKRVQFAWMDSSVCPSDLTNVFAFDDDYSMGVLCSATHRAWAGYQSSTFKQDPRYTPTTVFSTFPWPDPTSAQREVIGAASRFVVGLRSEYCAAHGIGLTELYNLLEEGAFSDLVSGHKDLDHAVAEAYGWPPKIGQDGTETNSRILELNSKIASGDFPYAPFARG